MNTGSLPFDDETQLYCNFGLHGWNDLIVFKDGEAQVFSVTDVFTDFASEILEICRAVLENTSLRVALCDEPGGVVFEVCRDKQQQHTMLLSIYEIERPLFGFSANETGKLVLTSRLRRQRLIEMLIAELWKTHISLKHRSFSDHRRVFPNRDLVELNALWHESSLGPSFLK
ncbi:hypothetical protein J7443_09820 [Tropicibacter sp. R15_0]|uniref:hypothetical protein n=1 Tax=Tropicibacter sp. R15_0 TaxID=2821101 RepID=UPI001ADAF4C1|nr:hypothetical protein [Tropicibacter sp. R15_0]MBO9465523.1 hypothetical protein [Tropicibacter sp. R15_0]